MSIRREIIEESVAWIAASPSREVGGKYVGRLAGEPVSGELDAGLELQVIHHLDAGPGAERTATFHRPDGRYQERVFRAIEAQDPQVRHLGSWHSHHPNGLAVLSQGDIRGYTRDVNSARHSHDIFLASLATDARGLAAARHFLFIRGRDEFFEIDPSCVSVTGDGRNPYARIVASCRAARPADPAARPADPAARSARPAARSARPAARRDPGLPAAARRGPVWAAASWAWSLLAAVRRRRPAPGRPAPPSPGGGVVSDAGDAAANPPAAARLPGWTHTAAGQDALARDRAWISSDHPELILVNRRGTLIWTGDIRHGEMDMTVTLAYPDDYPLSSPIVDVTGQADLLQASVQAILRAERDGDTYRTQLFLLLRSVARISSARTQP